MWPHSFLGKIRVLKWHDLCHRFVSLKYYNGVTEFFLIFPRNIAEKSSMHCQFARQIACSQNAWITFCPGLWYTPLLRLHPLETRNRNVVVKNLNQKHAAAFPDSNLTWPSRYHPCRFPIQNVTTLITFCPAPIKLSWTVCRPLRSDSVLSKTAIFPKKEGRKRDIFLTNLHGVRRSARPTSRWAPKAHRMMGKTQ